MLTNRTLYLSTIGLLIGVLFFSGIAPMASALSVPHSNTPHHQFYAWHTAPQFYAGTLGKNTRVNLAHRSSLTLQPGATQGTWESPVLPLAQGATTINPSWQANTPAGTHISVQLRVLNNNRWSKWYNMGEWGFENTVQFSRTSVNDQSDQDGAIFTDTYASNTEHTIKAYRLRVELHATGQTQPHLFQLAAQTASTSAFSSTSPTTMTHTVDFPVPQLSQYDHTGEYPAFGEGGEAWCSPTSVAMILKYFGRGPTSQDIASLPADPVFVSHERRDGEVPYAALHTYDKAYEGTGNWPFNTAYAAAYGLNTSVRVFTSLRDIESYIKRGQPVVISLNWNNEDSRTDNDLPGASVSKTAGHLMVVRGLTKQGDVIANDPAAPAGDTQVRHVYSRASLERQWLNGSNGTTYVFDR